MSFRYYKQKRTSMKYITMSFTQQLTQQLIHSLTWQLPLISIIIPIYSLCTRFHSQLYAFFEDNEWENKTKQQSTCYKHFQMTSYVLLFFSDDVITCVRFVGKNTCWVWICDNITAENTFRWQVHKTWWRVHILVHTMPQAERYIFSGLQAGFVELETWQKCSSDR